MSLRRAVIALGCLLVGALLAAPGALAATTFSDAFASRQTLEGFGTVTGSNVGATREAGEPALKPLAPAGHTVWVEWVATASGYVSFSTCDSSVDTVLAVYAGSQLDSLTEVGAVASHRPPGCSGVDDGVTFFAVAGTRLQVVVDGNAFLPPGGSAPSTEGPLALVVEATPVPDNDDFADATPILGHAYEEPGGARFYFGDRLGYNWGAGKEPGEPDHDGDPGGASVWYSWTAPKSQHARISVCCSAAQLLGVYRGEAVDALTPVASGKGSVEFAAEAGANYKIALDGEFDPVTGPRHDHFDLAVEMSPPLLPEDNGETEGLPTPSGFVPHVPPWDGPPWTRIVKARVRQRPHSATFVFASSATGASFRCRLDAGRWSPCVSPRVYRGVPPGAHAFEVYSVDPAGKADPTPVSAHFSIRPPRHRRHAAD